MNFCSQVTEVMAQWPWLNGYIITHFLYCWPFMKIPTPDSKFYGTNMGPTWDQQVPGGPHVGSMNLANWDT